jgi:hypothetical protein
MWSGDQAAIRAAVADILIWMSSDACTEAKLAEVRELLEKTVGKTMRNEEIKA